METAKDYVNKQLARSFAFQKTGQRKEYRKLTRLERATIINAMAKRGYVVTHSDLACDYTHDVASHFYDTAEQDYHHPERRLHMSYFFQEKQIRIIVTRYLPEPTTAFNQHQESWTEYVIDEFTA